MQQTNINKKNYKY